MTIWMETRRTSIRQYLNTKVHLLTLVTAITLLCSSGIIYNWKPNFVSHRKWIFLLFLIFCHQIFHDDIILYENIWKPATTNHYLNIYTNFHILLFYDTMTVLWERNYHNKLSFLFLFHFKKITRTWSILKHIFKSVIIIILFFDFLYAYFCTETFYNNNIRDRQCFNKVQI